ncbi:MAG TPA: cell shape determination protein CcmA [Flavobacteriaceae bacterium]|nr:cell shape determination protein CcmA [Flavobacteriaceae bacterium]HAT64729.1 cell shape determination protein CcmA [Flavobacteriaceae bacterium]|tara:strand:- start:135525 stop:135998 length:474 start_codon:yes stop_codon:yes gene_type:complete
MFSDKKNKNSMEPTSSQNRINEGTQLKGDIISNGFFRIDGTIEGNISKPSKIVLGKTGSIKGKLICDDADIEGKFEGNLNVSGTLTLKATAHIEGEVIVGKLSVEPGATFNATCTMHGTPKANISIPETQISESLKTKNHPFDRTQRSQKAKVEQQN